MKNIFSKPLKKGKSQYCDGVCAGIADFLNINPFWIRLLFFIGLFKTFWIVILYIILSILMEDPE